MYEDTTFQYIIASLSGLIWLKTILSLENLQSLGPILKIVIQMTK